MITEKLFYKKSIIFASILYVVVFIIFFGSLNLKHQFRSTALPNSAPKIVHAVTVDQKQVQNEIKKIKQEQQAKVNAEIARQKHLEKLASQAKLQRIQEQKYLSNLKAKQEQLERQQKAETAKATNKILQMQKQQQDMQKRLAELKKQRQQLATNVKDKISEQEKNKLQAEKQLQDQIAAEQKQIAAAHLSQLQSEIDRYKSLIINVIEQKWIIPPGISKDLSTQLSIKLAPGGTVLGVNVLRSSGNMVLDRSVITAVWKASPLPVPKKAEVFAEMRELHLTVKPEGFVT